jgi:nitrogen regulatory protein PII
LRDNHHETITAIIKPFKLDEVREALPKWASPA